MAGDVPALTLKREIKKYLKWEGVLRLLSFLSRAKIKMTPGNWEASSPFFLIQPAAVVAGEKIEEGEEEGKASVSDS